MLPPGTAGAELGPLLLGVQKLQYPPSLWAAPCLPTPGEPGGRDRREGQWEIGQLTQGLYMAQIATECMWLGE